MNKEKKEMLWEATASLPLWKRTLIRLQLRWLYWVEDRANKKS